MKKIAAIFLFLCLVFTPLASCTSPKADVWDGTVAEAFAGGEGTEASPFTIAKASQLAFLAAEINAGKDYAGKHFSLTRDLDLAMLDWTPIGNDTHSFNGSFDGNGHTVTNLKITNGAQITASTTVKENAQHSIGLFGSCYNATIQNLSIDKVEITMPIPHTVRAGALVGSAQADAHTKISGITVSNVTIATHKEPDTLPAFLYIGGIIGYANGTKEATYTLSRLQADAQISVKNGHAGDNYIGGLVGRLYIRNQGDVTDCASYLSVEVDTENCYSTRHYFGAFGVLGSVYFNNTISVSNLYSRVTVNKIHDSFHGYSAYTANAIAGVLDTGFREKGGYQFKNLYGCVEQIDEAPGQKATAMQLYEIPQDYPGYTETSCQGCESLPEGHGFDESIWDLKALFNPKLK